MMYALLASVRIVFVALYHNFDFAISAAGLAEDVQLFLKCHYQISILQSFYGAVL